VVATTLGLLAEKGLEGLTMRALAERLDVAPNAIYSHVASKTALIDDVLDEVLAEVEEPPSDTEDPSGGLRHLMASTYQVLLAHADLVPLYLARQGARGPHAQHLGDVMLALLGRAGINGAEAREAQRVLIVYTIGFAAFSSSPTARPPVVATGEVQARAERLDQNFDRGLRWLLAGIVSDGPTIRSSS
jgi:AcrR family transcriptional regulator